MAKTAWANVGAVEAGFEPGLERKLLAGIESGLIRDVHAVLVSRGDGLVLEQYCEGRDENWGQPLGTVVFDVETLHDLRSVTKSIVGLLYGIALDRGLVPPPEASLLAQFPEYADLAADPIRSGQTIGHALTMTLGLEWDEFRSYADPLNSEIAMENAPDRYRYALGQQVLHAPGTRWTYSGGAVALVGAIIARGTGKRLEDFAREALFAPLGISRFEWNCGRDGIASAASGLRLCARDLLRIGRMVLGHGLFEGRRIVSAAWVDASLTPAASAEDGLGYGRLWFTGETFVPASGGERPWMAGFGNGGQRLWLMPDADVACVIFSGNYNAPDAWVSPTRLWREIIAANLTTI
ncbi:beta-lactamase family protein [Shinella sp. CPCC 101442]|uniref:serine hydrolase domain-containing protein n=1 Tax=Shinella sp. CPCC 101442 TaxID=2932265 RepID=UPI002152FDCD|nr:serine hydrolase [Shinella sp. CPCC 101442]MCR6499776.1 beta-lactamase family protein [Shinella sp. CPCC 101442]